MNQAWSRFLLVMAVFITVGLFLLPMHCRERQAASPPVSAPTSIQIAAETNLGMTLQKITKRASEFTPHELADFTNKFEKKFKPVIERWCKIYDGRLPFRPSEVSIDKFHSRLGGYLYTFMIGSTTFTVADTKEGARVFYMITRDGSEKLNNLPRAGGMPVISMPVSRPIIVGLLKADAGFDYPADQVQMHPTGEFSALPGGVMVEAGGITGNNVYRAMTKTNLDFVLDANGNLVSYQH